MKLTERIDRLECEASARALAKARADARALSDEELEARCRATLARQDRLDPDGRDLTPDQRELIRKVRVVLARWDEERANAPGRTPENNDEN